VIVSGHHDFGATLVAAGALDAEVAALREIISGLEAAAPRRRVHRPLTDPT